ncbi:MAG TPA: hypothetical protein VJJ76_00740 [archaeon]|nr:hypothetical protein [archaeon]
MSAVIELRAPSYRAKVIKALKALGCYITAISRDFIGVRSIADKYEDKPADSVFENLIRSKRFIVPEEQFTKKDQYGRIFLTFSDSNEASSYISLMNSLNKEKIPHTELTKAQN